MTEVTFRIYFRQPDGTLEDGKDDYGLSDFGGLAPAPGDIIMRPGVRQGLDRTDPVNRRMWNVVQRVFNPRDNLEYVVLVVEERALTRAEGAFTGGR